MSQGEAQAVGRLCVAAVLLGPQQAEAIRRVSVQLLVAGSVETAAEVAAYFWQEAGAGGGVAAVVAPEPAAPAVKAVPPGAPGAPPAEQHPAASLEEAAQIELTSGMAALHVSGEAAPAPQAASAAAAPPAPAAAAPPQPEQPTAAELQEAAATVLAAAMAEVVEGGHTDAAVAVTELLLAAGQQELLHSVMTTMVEAGGWVGSGMGWGVRFGMGCRMGQEPSSGAWLWVGRDVTNCQSTMWGSLC